MKQFFLMFMLFGGIFNGGSTSQAQSQHTMTLEECITYALEHNTEVKNATLDEYIAQARIKEIVGLGYPQISGTAEGQYFFDLPTFVLPGELNPVPDPVTGELMPGPPQEAQFGFPYQATAGVNASQLVFDGTFFLGLKAARTYADLAQKQANQTRETIVQNVSQAYYQALIAKQQTELLTANITRIEKLLIETRALFDEGFVEKIDVDRLQINLNNLLLEQEKVQRLVALSEDLLKFQVGLPVQDQIILTEEIETLASEPNLDLSNFSPDQRVEIQLLNEQRTFESYNLRRIQVASYPSVYLFGSYQYNWQWNSFESFSDESAVFPISTLGVRVNVPIFSGFQRREQATQSRLAIRKIDNQTGQLKEAINLEIRQSQSNLLNAYNNLEAYQKNVELAQQVFDISTIKYKEGVGSSLEINDAESQLKTSQTQYLSGLLEYLLAKVDYQKATGALAVYHPLSTDNP